MSKSSDVPASVLDDMLKQKIESGEVKFSDSGGVYVRDRLREVADSPFFVDFGDIKPPTPLCGSPSDDEESDDLE